VIERVIYEVRIVKLNDKNTALVTCIEYVEAKDIMEANVKAEKLANEMNGDLKAVTAKPELIGVFELIEGEEDPSGYEPDKDAEDEFTADKDAEKKVSEKKKDVCARCGQPTVGGWAPKEK